MFFWEDLLNIDLHLKYRMEMIPIFEKVLILRVSGGWLAPNFQFLKRQDPMKINVLKCFMQMKVIYGQEIISWNIERAERVNSLTGIRIVKRDWFLGYLTTLFQFQGSRNIDCKGKRVWEKATLTYFEVRSPAEAGVTMEHACQRMLEPVWDSNRILSE